MIQKHTLQQIVIADLGAGNLNSVARALCKIGMRPVLASSARDILGADKIILPGVGHFARAMEELRARGLHDALNEAVLSKGKPVLGICLGMELMSGTSEEGDAKGLGWLDAATVRFSIHDRDRYKVPHMGWNTAAVRKENILFRGIGNESEFYFAHSYYVRCNHDSDIAAESCYEKTFTSAIEHDNIFGVQFHPEKSQGAGLRLLSNFVAV